MIEIITPANATDLTTVAAAKAELAITGSDQDARLADLITQASATISTFCDRVFGRETVRETIFQRNRTDACILARWPVVSIAAVSVCGIAFDADGYVVDRVAGMLYRRSATSGGLCWPAGETVVEYASGYRLPGEDDRDLPADIERAALLLVKTGYLATGRDPLLRSIEIPNVETVQFFAAPSDPVPLEVQALISGYRRTNIG